MIIYLEFGSTDSYYSQLPVPNYTKTPYSWLHYKIDFSLLDYFKLSLLKLIESFWSYIDDKIEDVPLFDNLI